MATSVASPPSVEPFALGAEKAILGACLLNAQAIKAARTIVTPWDFGHQDNGRIFAAMLALDDRGEPVDFLFLVDELKRAGCLESVGGSAWLASLTEGVPTAVNVEHYANAVRASARRLKFRNRLAEALKAFDDGRDSRALDDIRSLVSEAPATEQEDLAAAVELRVQDELFRERAKREARRRLDAEGRPVRGFEVLTLRERLARPQPPIKYRIEGLQPAGGRVVLAAQFKAGKTTLCGNLVPCLVDGGDFLGRFAVRPVTGTVIVIDAEMSPRQLDAWLGAHRIRHDDRVIPIPLRGSLSAFDILEPVSRAEWANSLRALEAEYLILDCFRPFADAFGVDEHRDAGRLLVALDALLEEAGIAEACVVHHMGHTGERARGDSRLRDWPDAEWRLVRQDEDPSSPRFFSAYGRDVEQDEARLEFDPQTRRLTIAGGSRRDAATDGALEAVLALLRAEHEPLSVRGIQTALAASEHPRDAIRAAIKLGVHRNLIVTSPGDRGAVLHQIARRQ